MKFKAVIFDLDGTLLDTIEDLTDSMNTVLAGLELPLHSVSEFKKLVGKGMRNLVVSSLPESMQTDEIVDRCYNSMFETYGNRWDVKTRPYDGIPELLDSLTEKNIHLAILSNKIDKITQLIVQKYFPGWKFDAVFGERPGVPRKPDPAALNEIIQIMQLEPAEIICLGDSGSDMEAAIKAGAYPVGALWGFRDADELLSHGAKIMIKKPGELLELF